MTLDDLIGDLKRAAPETDLVFATDAGPLSGGYHVTEFKRLDIASIDCGGTQSARRETVMQLLDGHGGTHMKTGKFVSIAERSAAAVPGLEAGPLQVECALGNLGLGLYKVRAVEAAAGQTIVHLTNDQAECRPARRLASRSGSSCCTPA